ncbi:hypothetical protein X276_21010 [Clostridium beijerinckii NRRL B-598]|nr:hypothetical protein X276_21010 [Clostridium beijerinckii NRRL B-598]
MIPKSYKNIAEGSKQQVASNLACSNFPSESRLITFAEEVREPKIKFWTLTSQTKLEQPLAETLLMFVR